MRSDLVVKVENLSKRYKIFDGPAFRFLGQLFPNLIKPTSVVNAVNNVSFELNRGEVLGIIGRNGSGKSTLLQMLCGTVAPSSGEVVCNGKIGALLELGSGFNPELTGIENINLNASILGVSKRNPRELIDRVAEFAGIGDYIYQPVKLYSSGMALRLAFAVHSQLNPDLLIIDEALAVGDASFQSKCFAKLQELKDSGAAIILVTHSAEQIVSHCNRAIFLDAGRMKCLGDPRQVVLEYVSSFTDTTILDADKRSLPTVVSGVSNSQSDDHLKKNPLYNPSEYRWGNGEAKIIDCKMMILDTKEENPNFFSFGQTVKVSIRIKTTINLNNYVIGFTVKTVEGLTVYGSNNSNSGVEDQKIDANGERSFDLTFKVFLAPGDYFLSLGIVSNQFGELVPLDRRYDVIHFKVQNRANTYGFADLDLKFLD